MATELIFGSLCFLSPSPVYVRTGPNKHKRRRIPIAAAAAQLVGALIPIELADQRPQNGLLEGQLTDADRQPRNARATIGPPPATPPPPHTVLALCRVAGGADPRVLHGGQRRLLFAVGE